MFRYQSVFACLCGAAFLSGCASTVQNLRSEAGMEPLKSMQTAKADVRSAVKQQDMLSTLATSVDFGTTRELRVYPVQFKRPIPVEVLAELTDYTRMVPEYRGGVAPGGEIQIESSGKSVPFRPRILRTLVVNNGKVEMTLEAEVNPEATGVQIYLPNGVEIASKQLLVLLPRGKGGVDASGRYHAVADPSIPPASLASTDPTAVLTFNRDTPVGRGYLEVKAHQYRYRVIDAALWLRLDALVYGASLSNRSGVVNCFATEGALSVELLSAIKTLPLQLLGNIVANRQVFQESCGHDPVEAYRNHQTSQKTSGVVAVRDLP